MLYVIKHTIIYVIWVYDLLLPFRNSLIFFIIISALSHTLRKLIGKFYFKPIFITSDLKKKMTWPKF